MSKSLLIFGGIAAVLLLFRTEISRMFNAILPGASPEEAKIDSSQPSAYRENYVMPAYQPYYTSITPDGKVEAITPTPGTITSEAGVGRVSFSEPMGNLQYPAGSGRQSPSLTQTSTSPTDSGKWDNALTAITLGAIVGPPAYRAAQKVLPQAIQRGKAAAESVGARIGAVIEDAAAAIPAAASRIAASPVKAGAAAVVITGGAYAVTHPTETKAAISTIAQKSAAVVDVVKQRLTSPPTKPVLLPAIFKAVTGK